MITVEATLELSQDFFGNYLESLEENSDQKFSYDRK